jgi:thioredoxin-like negative regulator of GroEL
MGNYIKLFFYFIFVLAVSCDSNSEKEDRNTIKTEDGHLESNTQKGKSQTGRVNGASVFHKGKNINSSSSVELVDMLRNLISADYDEVNHKKLESVLTALADQDSLLACQLFAECLAKGYCLNPQCILNYMDAENQKFYIDMYRELPADFKNDLLLSSSIDYFCSQNKLESVIALLKASQSDLKNKMLSVSIAQLVKSEDNSQLIKMVTAELNGKDRVIALASIGQQTMALGNAEEAFSLIDSIEDEKTKHEVTLEMAMLLANTHGEDKSFEVLAKLPSEYKSKFLTNDYLMGNLIKASPGRALKLFDGLALTDHNRKIISKNLAGIMVKDPQATIEWLNDQARQGGITTFSYDAFAGLIDTTNEKINEYVTSLDPSLRDNALKGFVNSCSKNGDLSNALNIASTADLKVQQNLYREISKTSALNNPANALLIIEDAQLSEKIGAEFRNEMINHTVQNWAKQDREAAQQWVEKLPAADQTKGTQGLVAQWMKTDPIAASEWLSQQPAGPARDAGAQEIINQIKDTDPEMAEQWRKSMTPKPE